VKPLKLALFIAAACIFFAGLNFVIGKVRYVQNESKVNDLIKQIKALGVATTDKDFFHPILDSENAWIDIKPLLTKSKVNGYERYPFDSQLPTSFLMVAQQKDVATMQKYLAVNKTKRDAILAALESKPKLQMHLNHDNGIVEIDSLVKVIGNLQYELCLASFTAALEGNKSEMFRNLKALIRLISFNLEWGEYRSTKVGISGRLDFLKTLLRILEVKPEYEDSLRDFCSAQPPIPKTNYQKIVESSFLTEVGTIRYFDVPDMDRSQPLFSSSSSQEESAPDSAGSAKHNDHIPNSPAVRNYLVKRLQKMVTIAGPCASKKVSEYSSRQVRSRRTCRRI
jgi:hypothetical protein